MQQERVAPTIPGWPIVGELGIFKDTVAYLLDGRRHGKIVALRVLHIDVLLVYSPSGAEHVLVGNQRNYKKDHYIQRAFRVFGNGLLRAEGACVAGAARRLMQPGFHRQRIRGYAETMLVRLTTPFVAALCATARRWIFTSIS